MTGEKSLLRGACAERAFVLIKDPTPVHRRPTCHVRAP